MDKLLTYTANFSTTLDIATLTLPNSSKVPANHTRQEHVLLKKATGISDSGATDVYFSTDSPVVNIDRAAPKVTIGTATGQTQKSAGTGNLALPNLPSGFTIKGHPIHGFFHTLIRLGPLFDADCTVTFTHEAVIVCNKQGTAVLTGSCEDTCPRL